MKKVTTRKSPSPIRPSWQTGPCRPLSGAWKRWLAECFIRSIDGVSRKDALEILALAHTMVPQRGRILWDWSTDAKHRHPH
jgi:hypothetical protein